MAKPCPESKVSPDPNQMDDVEIQIGEVEKSYSFLRFVNGGKCSLEIIRGMSGFEA